MKIRALHFRMIRRRGVQKRPVKVRENVPTSYIVFKAFLDSSWWLNTAPWSVKSLWNILKFRLLSLLWRRCKFKAKLRHTDEASTTVYVCVLWRKKTLIITQLAAGLRQKVWTFFWRGPLKFDQLVLVECVHYRLSGQFHDLCASSALIMLRRKKLLHVLLKKAVIWKQNSYV